MVPVSALKKGKYLMKMGCATAAMLQGACSVLPQTLTPARYAQITQPIRRMEMKQQRVVNA